MMKDMEIKSDDSEDTKARKSKDRKTYEQKIANEIEDYSDSYSESPDVGISSGSEKGAENKHQSSSACALPATQESEPPRTPSKPSAHKKNRRKAEDADEDMQDIERSTPAGQRTPESGRRRKERKARGNTGKTAYEKDQDWWKDPSKYDEKDELRDQQDCAAQCQEGLHLNQHRNGQTKEEERAARANKKKTTRGQTPKTPTRKKRHANEAEVNKND